MHRAPRPATKWLGEAKLLPAAALMTIVVAGLAHSAPYRRPARRFLEIPSNRVGTNNRIGPGARSEKAGT
jgi:hypothetical protein